MTYEPIKFMEPMIKFVESCPFLGASGKLEGAPFSKDVLDGNALMYVGTGKPRLEKYIGGDLILTKQANFVLQFRRLIADNIFNVEMADLMAAFEEWVENENYSGKPPRFSNINYPNERIWADNGMLLDIYDNPEPFMLFQVQMHIEYAVYYKTHKE